MKGGIIAELFVNIHFLVPQSEIRINTRFRLKMRIIAELKCYIEKIANLPLFIYVKLVPQLLSIYG